MQTPTTKTDSAHYRTFLSAAQVLAVALTLAACQSVPPPRDSASLQERVETAQAAASAEARELLPNESEIRLLVYRDGPLAGFGHNHVITAPVTGTLYDGGAPADSGFSLHIDVHDFVVDPPAARDEEGEAFSETVSPQARKGTRENMLGSKLLDAERYPAIGIVSARLRGPRWNPTVIANVDLHGRTRSLEFPAAVSEDGDRLVVIANLSIRQSDFGIEPFSILGGGLKVRDTVDIRLRLVAGRKSE